MKPDMRREAPAPAVDDVERAHLKEPSDTSHEMFRYAGPDELSGLVRRFWIPVWSLATGQSAPQNVLQYPVCLLVVTPEYARFYGVTSGLSTTTLAGEGWAVGVMCEPAAGYLLTGRSVDEFTDRHVDLADALGDDARALVHDIRSAMAQDPRAPDSHTGAMAAYGRALRQFTPVDDEGLLVNKLVSFVENTAEVTRVSQVCDVFSMTERSLQRLVHRRLGLTPKWLIQRRRLHDAVGRLRERSTTLAEVAAELGYADEAHFIRGFSSVTGTTPGRFANVHSPHRS